MAGHGGSGGSLPAKAIPFDHTTQELVLDFAGLSKLPTSPDEAARSFRAVVVPKGYCQHHPEEAGVFAVFGKWTVITSFFLVHFDEKTKREPALLLNFRDWSVASVEHSGVEVETLELPLLKSNNKYRTEAFATKIELVAGFEPVDVNAAPYSMHLAPCLKQIAQFKAMGIASAADVASWMEKKPMSEKVEKLKSCAEAEIQAASEARSRVSAQSGDKFKSQATAYLTNRYKALKALGDSGAYDCPLSDRIFDLFSGDEAVSLPSWLSSPEFRALASESKVAQLNRTALVPRGDAVVSRLAFSSVVVEAAGGGAAAAPAPTDSEAASSAGADKLDDSDDNEFEHSSDASPAPAPAATSSALPSGSKRPRLAPQRMPAGGDPPRAQAKTPAAAAASKPAAKAEPKHPLPKRKGRPSDAADLLVINPRSKVPYTRGPYMRRSAAVQQVRKAARLPPPSNVDEARADAFVAEMQLDAANKRLEAAKEEIQALRKARDEREAQLEKASLEAARETAEMLRTEFQRGLEMGAKLATGQFAAAFASSAPAPAHAR